MTASPKKTKLPAPGSRLPAPGSATTAPSEQLTASVSKRRDLYVTLLVLALACGVGWWIGATETLPPPNGGLIVDEKDLDFGEAWEQPSFCWKFTVRNPTARDVQILNWFNSCGCASIEPKSIFVKARGKAEVVATLDLRAPFERNRDAPDKEADPGITQRFAAEVVPQIAGQKDAALSNANKTWQISGTVKRVLSVRPGTLHLGQELVRGTEFGTKTAKVIACIRLHELVAKVPPGSGHRVSVRSLQDDMSEWELEFELARDTPAGHVEFPIELACHATTGEQLPTVSLKVLGEVREDIHAVPPNIHFGVQENGAIVAAPLMIRSHSGKPFRVEKATPLSKHITLSRESDVDSGLVQEARYLIKLLISEPRDFVQRAEFFVRTEQGELVVVRVVASAFGIEPKSVDRAR